jgi:hypothetical protein
MVGCADLPPIPSAVCGNGVVDTELGEVCDTFVDPALGPGLTCGRPDDPVRQCRITCVQGADGSLCPAGWGCSQGGVCHYATGQYAEAPGSPWRMDAEKIQLGDIDGDGIGDLIGSSPSDISVRFGTRDGQFPDTFTLRTDFREGAPVFADLDGDLRTDAVVPITPGLFVALGQADRALQPVTYSPYDLEKDENGNTVTPPPGGVLFLPLDADVGRMGDELLGMIGLDIGVGMKFLASSQGEKDGPDVGLLGPYALQEGGPGTNRILAGRVPVANIDDDKDSKWEEEFALVFTGVPTVFVYEAGTDATGGLMSVLRQTVDLPDDVLYGARFIDFDGDGLLDLMVSVGDVGDDRVAVARGTTTGQFGGAVEETFFDQILDSTRFSRWPVGAADLNGDGAWDFIGRDGAYVRWDDTLYLMAYRISPDAWIEAQAADFNRDGRMDFAAASGLRGIDLYLGNGDGFFNRFRVDTENAPFALRTGDFDGDFVTDLVIGEHALEADFLSVLFGTIRGGLEPPVSMGSIGSIDFVEPLDGMVDPAIQDVITDLVVGSHSALSRNERAVALMIGSSGRRLLSPFALQIERSRTNTPIVVQAGHLDRSGDEAVDLVAIAPPNVWLVKGRGEAGARYAQDDTEYVAGTGMSKEFADRCVLWTTGPVDATRVGFFDSLIGVRTDEADACDTPGAEMSGATKPQLLVGSWGTRAISTEVNILSETKRAPRSLSLVDVDGDGTLDLVVTFAGDQDVLPPDPVAPRPPDNAGVVVYWNRGDALVYSLDLASDVPPLPSAAVYGAAVINADQDPQKELAILTDTGVFVVEVGAERQFSSPSVPAVQQYFTYLGVLVADVNHDDLDDLLVPDYLGPAVHVYLATSSEAR